MRPTCGGGEGVLVAGVGALVVGVVQVGVGASMAVRDRGAWG